MTVYLLPKAPIFPPIEEAEAGGLLAVGGDLSTERLLAAYHAGIFPCYGTEDPILWWSTDPRLVLFPDELHVPRRLERVVRSGRFRITFDEAFPRVILACAEAPNRRRPEPWIHPEMRKAYTALHEAGYAHSVETWFGDELAGGLYGVAVGKAFFGESMFALRSDASKVALVALVRYLSRNGFHFLDCQQTTEHLRRMGAREIPRAEFSQTLAAAVAEEGIMGKWKS